MPVFRWQRKRPNAANSLARGISIKVLHSFYRSSQPSGENEAVITQVNLLAEAGFDVELIYLSSDDLEISPSAKALTAVGMTLGTPTVSPPEDWLIGTDVLHIHNTFPSISNKWLRDLSVPKVMTVHNYRAFCANGLFLRDGKRCLDCAMGNSTSAVFHGCYRGSHLQSLPIAIQQTSSHSLVGVMRQCHLVLIPGNPMRDVFKTLGVHNTQVLHNPVTTPPTRTTTTTLRDAWLFVGRITQEKGLADLLRFWSTRELLIVVGDGPDRELAESIAIERRLRVQFAGNLEGESVRSLMSSNRGLIFPSKALEGAPLVYGEAMQAGLPIVAAEGSTLATQTAEDQTGTVFSWNDPASLIAALRSVGDHRAEFAARARLIYEKRYMPDVWIDQVSKVYVEAISAYRSK